MYLGQSIGAQLYLRTVLALACVVVPGLVDFSVTNCKYSGTETDSLG